MIIVLKCLITLEPLILSIWFLRFLVESHIFGVYDAGDHTIRFCSIDLEGNSCSFFLWANEQWPNYLCCSMEDIFLKKLLKVTLVSVCSRDFHRKDVDKFRWRSKNIQVHVKSLDWQIHPFSDKASSNTGTWSVPDWIQMNCGSWCRLLEENRKQK